MEERYIRQTVLSQVGEAGQKKLAETLVAVIGAGGLGCPVLTYLTEAGVKHLRIIDNDVVSKSNLNRQFLHTPSDIGHLKVESAAEKLTSLNPELQLELQAEYLTKENIDFLLAGAEVVVDCVDSIAVRLLVGAYCVEKNIPLVEAGMKGFYGWVTTIKRESACLSCLGYHEGMEEKAIPALGTTAGVLGSLQANEVLKIILGAGEPLYNRMLQYDGLLGSIDEIPLQVNPDCSVHKKIEI